jgi:hypothetical protein
MNKLIEAKYGEKMRERLERCAKMKKLIGKRYQNMIKMKSDAKIWERWKEMPQYAIVAM